MSKPPSDIPPPASSSSDVFSDAVSPGRRDFLKLTAAAGATLLGGCLNDDDPPQELGATAASIAKFDHMVVVMFENRSFDGLLGYCYQATDPTAPQPDVQRTRRQGVPQSGTGVHQRRQRRRRDADKSWHRGRHAEPESRSGRGVSACQHRAVQHRQPDHQPVSRCGRDAVPVQRTPVRNGGDDAGFRLGLLQQLRLAQQAQPDVRRISGDHGQLQSGAAARDQRACEGVCSLRRVAARCRRRRFPTGPSSTRRAHPASW